MNVEQIRALRPQLQTYLSEFASCFARQDTRAHLPCYVEGQLSDLERKSVEPIALEAGQPVRTLQEFLSQHRWDQQQMRTRLQQVVVRDHAGVHGIGLIDETRYVKKGNKTPEVQRQYCGAVGKCENCLVSVHLGYARDGFHCLLDSDLYLPASWAQDRPRCREAGIPDDVDYRPKTDIALALYDHARECGMTFEWLTFDEGYGGKPPFLRALEQRGQTFVGEVPVTFMAWATPPRVTHRPYRHTGRGRARKTPRLVAGSPGPRPVEQLLRCHRPLRDAPWQHWRVKDDETGPQVWEAKHALSYLPDEAGLPGQAHHLLVARNVLDPDKLKYFVSNADPACSEGMLLKVAFSRWHIERCLEDLKGEVGLDHYEGRRWLGWQRHLVLSAVSFLFLARVHQALKEKKSTADALPGAHGCRGRGPRLELDRAGRDNLVRENGS